ncbi:MAG: L,D-transpeptidase [Clostridiales bacterium]|nr:L,D-transpeptidase [Clostridiales bacterium]
MCKLFFCVFVFTALTFTLYIKGSTQVYTSDEINSAEKKAVPSPVYGEIRKGTRLYNLPSEDSSFEETAERERVLILRDFSLSWYYIERESGRAWVKPESITIPSDPLTAEDSLTAEEIECCINTRGFKSKTDKFVWADIYRQRVYILKGTAGKFRLEKRIVCGTGKNISPTTRWLFEISDRGEWFYSARLKSGAKYWVRFNEAYLFHSVAMDKESNITDPTLGRHCSSGCIRMSVNDAEYFYKTIPKDTAVWVN